MTQLHFNLNMDELKDAVMGSDLNALMKSVLVIILNEYMEKERDGFLEVGRYERTDSRDDYRNGYYERELLVSIGRLKLLVPRTRSGEFSTTLFEKYKRSDQAFVLSMLEMFINGVSTRKVKNVVQELCGETVSKSFVSSLTVKVDPMVRQWAERPLNVMHYPYVFVDALYTKVRENDRVVSKAIYIATAISKEKKREILGFSVDHQESCESWKKFLQSLLDRGLNSPRLVISDAHAGLKKAIQEVFVGTSWQRCTVHFLRNLIGKLPKRDSDEAKKELKQIFRMSKIEDARELYQDFMKKYEGNKKYQTVTEALDEGLEDAIQYMNEPEEYHQYIRTTNHLERINREVRRREKVIQVFPNHQSAYRLTGAILMDYHEQLQAKRKI